MVNLSVPRVLDYLQYVGVTYCCPASLLTTNNVSQRKEEEESMQLVSEKAGRQSIYRAQLGGHFCSRRQRKGSQLQIHAKTLRKNLIFLEIIFVFQESHCQYNNFWMVAGCLMIIVYP